MYFIYNVDTVCKIQPSIQTKVRKYLLLVM